jgi:hypothetical protein
LTAQVIRVASPTDADRGDVLAARNGDLVCWNNNCFNWYFILTVKLIPLDRANDIQNGESKHEQPDQTAQHKADPLKNFAYHQDILLPLAFIHLMAEGLTIDEAPAQRQPLTHLAIHP